MPPFVQLLTIEPPQTVRAPFGNWAPPTPEHGAAAALALLFCTDTFE